MERRNFIKTTGTTSMLLSIGSIFPGFLATSCGRRKDADNKQVYYDQEIDGGRTWDNFRIVAERDENSVNVYSPNFLRLKNGEILLLFLRYNQLMPDKPQLATAYTIRSRDEGKTFSTPVPVWQQEQFAFSNSCMMRLSSGRVILPVQHTSGNLWSPSEKCHIRVFV